MTAGKEHGAVVTHPDRQDRGVVVDSRAPSWTPDNLTTEPPDAGMVKVRWSDSVDRSALFWEYAAELVPVNIVGVCRKGRVGQPLMLDEPMPAGLAGAAAAVDRDDPPRPVADLRDDSPWRNA